MGIQIEDGRGTGILTAVNDENMLRSISVAGTMSCHASIDEGDTFTVLGTATVASGTVVALFLQNNDPTLLFLLDHLTVQGVSITGGVTLPSANSFFSLGYNRTTTSGGATLTPVCLNRTSVTVANVTTLGSNPNMTGTFVEAQRWYIQANGITNDLALPRDDDIILGRTNTLEVRYQSDNTTGIILANMKFMLRKTDEFP